ncbi:MAG: proline dehydrogenase family protein [Thermoanaerobaculia bacterium]
MSVARSLLLRASRSPWLADQFRRRRFARRAVRRFMPGEDLESALGAADEFARSGRGTVLTNLGERIESLHDASAVRDHYLHVLDAIAQRNLPTQISVKLTHLGLSVDGAACTRSVVTLARRAADTGSFVWIDMEESQYVDPTLDVFRSARGESDKVGLCLQSYLRRTPADLDALLPLSPAIRLVKGAYRESPEIAFPNKRDTDRAYLELSDRMLAAAVAGQGVAVFGTHDLSLVERIRRRAAELQVPRHSFEVHMLYGIKSGEQQSLASSGVAVRVLISYGSNWFPWYVRRLAERPANVWFVVRNLW